MRSNLFQDRSKSPTSQNFRKFNRTQRSNSKPRTNSNKSESTSLSKFYNKNLMKKIQDQNQINYRNSIFDKQVDTIAQRPRISALQSNKILETAASLHNYQKNSPSASTHVYQKMSSNTYTSDFTTSSQKKIQLNLEIQLQQKVKLLEEQLIKVKKENQALSVQNRNLSKKIQGNSILGKNKEVCSINSLKNIKRHIYSEKLNEYKQQNMVLRAKIVELEKTIDQLKLSVSQIMKRSQLSSQSPGQLLFANEIFQHSIIENNIDQQAYNQLQNSLKQSKIQITKLHLHYNGQLRKLVHEKQAIIEKKDQQYRNLKKKFLEYLSKNKEKKNASLMAKQKIIDCKFGCDLTEQSLLLNLSEDSANMH